MIGSVAAAKNDLIQNVDRLKVLLQQTPDGRLYFKPSETARSIGEVVSHVTNALENILSQLKGVPFDLPSNEVADPVFREHDAAIRSRETLLLELEKATN